jgi:acylphosphatase
MTKHVKILVSGKVQGVYFRVHAKNKADELNLVGIVKNTPEGKVYIEAEGTDDNLYTFIEWCKIGSPDAEVKRIETTEDSPKDFKNFSIEH